MLLSLLNLIKDTYLYVLLIYLIIFAQNLHNKINNPANNEDGYRVLIRIIADGTEARNNTRVFR